MSALSLCVDQADEAFRIGPPPAAESYLRGDALLDIAARSGAQVATAPMPPLVDGVDSLEDDELYAVIA